MTTTNNMNTKFEFRTKFKKLLNDANRSSIIRAFNQFCSLDSKNARNVLWGMTYSQEKALEEIYKLGLNTDIIPSEKVLVLRNELRYQYEELVEDGFLQFYKGDDEKISNAFTLLKNHSDTIVASTVCDFCSIYAQKPGVERILYLLSSKKETCRFGGIRSLGFDMVESDYLKPFHLEIRNLLEAMNNSIPFYMEEEVKEEVIAKIVEEESEALKEEILEKTHQNFKSLTPEEILIHRDVFESYAYGNDMNILVQIANLGFDLNEVMAKAEKIQTFILAAENLS